MVANILIIACLVTLSACLGLLVWHLRGESQRMAALAREAFGHIKAGDLTEKVRAESLDRQLQKLEKDGVPTPVQQPAPAPNSSKLYEEALRRGRAKDNTGDEWELV